MSALVDTNVLLRAVQVEHPDHLLATRALSALLLSGEGPHVCPQNIYEFWVVATRPAAMNGLAMAPSQAAQNIERILRWFVLCPDSPEVMPVWLELVTRYGVSGKAAHDARLVASAINSKLKAMVTFNAGHFSRFSELQVLTPEQVLAESHPS